jgi:hypothetical protein
MEIQINIWAVLLAMASSMVVGSVWYAQGVFGKTWAKLAKIDMSKNTDASAARPIIVTMIVSLLTAYVLAHITYLAHQFYDNSFLTAALSTAVWAWAGLTAARFITHDAFEGRPFKLTFINIAHEFVTFMIMGLVIGLMGV